jgi:hypothetical protein
MAQNFTPVRSLGREPDIREIKDAVNSIIRHFPQHGAADYRAIKTCTANYSVTDGDYTILADASATTTVQVSLPSVSSYAWRVLQVLKIDSSANTVKILPVGAEKINGAASKTTTTQYAGWRLHTDGAAWYII